MVSLNGSIESSGPDMAFINKYLLPKFICQIWLTKGPPKGWSSSNATLNVKLGIGELLLKMKQGYKVNISGTIGPTDVDLYSDADDLQITGRLDSRIDKQYPVSGVMVSKLKI
jgi:hypothetical protein